MTRSLTMGVLIGCTLGLICWASMAIAAWLVASILLGS